MTYPTLSNDLIHKNSQVEGEKCGIEQVLGVYCMSVVVGFNSLNLNALFIEDTVWGRKQHWGKEERVPLLKINMATASYEFSGILPCNCKSTITSVSLQWKYWSVLWTLHNGKRNYSLCSEMRFVFTLRWYWRARIIQNLARSWTTGGSGRRQC